MLAIEVHDVHKSFRIPHEVHTTLTERLLSLLRPVSYEHFEALRGVDLEVEKGSFIGVIGGNGSGKSTLLKIISGLLLPDAGAVQVRGTMSALLELGLGFSPELTVRENVELYAAVLGYPRREVARRVEEAIDFAGLDRFRDAKLKNLSTGMRARLGFATALQAESDIMLLDEILAVGDADFQLKCLNVFEDFKLQRRTILLVTHDLGQVQRFCDEAVLLDKGRIVIRDEPDAVIARYLGSVGQATFTMPEDAVGQHWGDGRVRIVAGWLEDEHGARVGRVRSGGRATIVLRVEVHEDTEDSVFGFSLRGEGGGEVYSINTRFLGTAAPVLRRGRTAEIRASFAAVLRNGPYAVTVAISNAEMTNFHDLTEILSFVVQGSTCRQGLADLQGRVVFGDPGDAIEATDEPERLRHEGGAR
jgi:ABC-type polysaccharide/polyol phosphate transport system ATPase subunit